jgi:hypothetical protein
MTPTRNQLEQASVATGAPARLHQETGRLWRSLLARALAGVGILILLIAGLVLSRP